MTAGRGAFAAVDLRFRPAATLPLVLRALSAIFRVKVA
jgi:hypothetical protein